MHDERSDLTTQQKLFYDVAWNTYCKNGYTSISTEKIISCLITESAMSDEREMKNNRQHKVYLVLTKKYFHILPCRRTKLDFGLDNYS